MTTDDRPPVRFPDRPHNPPQPILYYVRRCRRSYPREMVTLVDGEWDLEGECL